MYKTITEILAQCGALKQTAVELNNKKADIRAFFDGSDYKNIIFIGCGSSYCVAKSAASAVREYVGLPSYAVCAGDLFLNARSYANDLKDTVLVSFSRSGSTSEVIYAVNKARELYPGVKYLAFNGVQDSPLSKLANFNVELPWAVDKSVCQTGSVSNMYFAGMTLAAILADDDGLIKSLDAIVVYGDGYMAALEETMKNAARGGWDSVVVLADGVLEGIAEESALAFKEICMIPSNYYHLLDFRHGPIVLTNSKTLVLAALSPGDTSYQFKLLEDVKRKGATIVAIGDESHAGSPADNNITIPATGHLAAYGLTLLFASQLAAFHKAVYTDINPDAPAGLDPWIKI